MGSHPKTIAIDFDGVIHAYRKGWQDGTIYDEPVPRAFEIIDTLIQSGHAVFIFTTRNAGDVYKWMIKHILTPEGTFIYGYGCVQIPEGEKFWNQTGFVGITNTKLPAHAYVDDRAIKFEGDWLKTFTDIMTFKTYPEYPKEYNLASPKEPNNWTDLLPADDINRLMDDNYRQHHFLNKEIQEVRTLLLDNYFTLDERILAGQYHTVDLVKKVIDKIKGEKNGGTN